MGWGEDNYFLPGGLLDTLLGFAEPVTNPGFKFVNLKDGSLCEGKEVVYRRQSAGGEDGSYGE